ncbi:hypothetical protein EUZ11_18415 [Salmonella enterica]|nr:hypothetical protein [Salmonella enterica subsp. enterica serovar Rubislaw]EAV1202443.1 hypothetical protein [Salmonella enterica]
MNLIKDPDDQLSVTMDGRNEMMHCYARIKYTVYRFWVLAILRCFERRISILIFIAIMQNLKITFLAFTFLAFSEGCD